MADILSFLKQSAQTKAKTTRTITRPSESDYEFQNDDYRLPLGKTKEQGGDMQ